MQIAQGKEQNWQDWQEKNTDFYGAGVINPAVITISSK